MHSMRPNNARIRLMTDLMKSITDLAFVTAVAAGFSVHVAD